MGKFGNEYVTIAVNRNLSNCEIARKNVFRGFNGIRTRGPICQGNFVWVRSFEK